MASRVILLRGHQANPWELRPWTLLEGRYDVGVLVPRHPLAELSGLELRRVRAATLADMLPAPARVALAGLPLNRHIGLADKLAGADVVHAAELTFFFTAQAAALKSRLGFKLVTTVWETIPFRASGRNPVSRRHRARVLAATDLFLATTERARACLLLEGVDPSRVDVAAPGIDVERFAAASRADAREPVVISPGRLVWEKGHQDVLRAAAAVRAGLAEGPRDLRVLVLGSGREERTLRAYAKDLRLPAEFRPGVPYDEMPAMYARAGAMALGSLPTRRWEEQFGMVLPEAMAAGLPVVTTMSGAIPEVVGNRAALVAPGDWLGMARALGACVGRSVPHDPARLERFGLAAAADRYAAAYARVLG